VAQGPLGDNPGTSTRPYLVRALHEWCSDNGFTPYVAVHVDSTVQVPMEYVKNNEIVLNISFEATSNLKLGNEFIEFKARFGGVTREIVVPLDHVVAIYARENGQGMAFPMPAGGASAGRAGADGTAPAEPGPEGAAEPGDAAPPRGLRLASTEPATAGKAGEGDDPEPPAPAPGSDGPRPALKRIK
jgi:stringent starvation protein B